MDDAERRARDLLAEAFREEVPTSETAKVIEEGFDGVISSRFAIRAITKILRTTPPAVGGMNPQEIAGAVSRLAVEIRASDKSADWKSGASYMSGFVKECALDAPAPQPREDEA